MERLIKCFLGLIIIQNFGGKNLANWKLKFSGPNFPVKNYIQLNMCSSVQVSVK